ncbi:pif1 [Symbiodinium natans]|uniref:Pif1 protein n=1 Tax=Symbiodinium natans TaxID=878477 RepID=A0A812J8I8_9DINO|nr:pif1 [Symbiodinium natans]
MHPTAWPWDALNWLYRTDKLFSWASNDTDRVHEECDAYWRKLAKESMDVKGPDARMTFPLNWHADGVRVYKQQKCWVYSYSCALKKGPSLSSKLMLLLVREPLLRKPDTHDAIGKVIGWIQRVLQTGLFPPTDFMGSAWPPDSLEAARANLPFAGGYKCAFSAFKGDWEARAVIHKLQRSYNHNNICEHCPASKLDNGFNYRDFSLNAPYLDGQPWTPAYWQLRHAALLDLQRQCGAPVLFKTPYEWAAPYHRWLLHAMETERKGRLHLAGPETLHLCHIMTEMFRVWVHGGAVKHGAASSCWSQPSLGPRAASDAYPVLNFAGRIEFEDGKRKLATQEADHPLRGYALDGQAGRTGSGWPLHEGESCFTPEGYLRLRHTETDSDMGIRAYDVEEMDVMKFHQDHVVPNEHLDGRSTGYGMAIRTLSTYQPGEPEMWLALAAQLLPQFFLGGTMRPAQAPWPGMPDKPQFVEQYETCAWRSEHMSLLEWLQKTNDKGEIVSWVKKAHARHGAGMSLTEFACSCETKGEKVIAAETVRIFNDKYFGQWLALNLPFRDLGDLLDVQILGRVPEHYVLHACALKRAGGRWADDAKVKATLQLAGHRDGYIDNALAMLHGQRSLIQKYMDGSLRKDDPLPAPSTTSALAGLDTEETEIDVDQTILARAINDRIDRALLPRLMQEAAEANSILVCTGPPGCGKTAVAAVCLQRAERRGARILYALPTGQLAARTRQRHPDIDVDTCHSAFLLHQPLQESLALLTIYDLVIVDEALQLSAEHFERLHEMWRAASCCACLLLLGDPWRLPSVSGSSADASPKWSLCHHVRLHRIHRCRDEVLGRKLATLRMNKPMGAEGLRFVTQDICRGHKAWSGRREPTALDVQDVLARTGNATTFVTCTKRGAAVINQHATQVLFHNRNKRLLAEIPGDYEDNEANYDEAGRLREDRPPQPSAVPLYQGLRVVLTRNLDKEHHYVNGMTATVQDFDAASNSVVVRTETGYVLSIYRYTDENAPTGRVLYFPLRLGYAGAIYKYQGAELPHVTVWLDRPMRPAAGYVALSRVKYDRDYLIGGVVTVDDFVPAR